LVCEGREVVVKLELANSLRRKKNTQRGINEIFLPQGFIQNGQKEKGRN
jgi:hypothetical protein